MENTGDAKSPVREAQVVRELNLGGQACGKLKAVVETLEERLSSVLRKEPSVGAGTAAPGLSDAKGKDPEELVPLAHEIRTIHEAVTDQVDRLERVIGRLEL